MSIYSMLVYFSLRAICAVCVDDISSEKLVPNYIIHMFHVQSGVQVFVRHRENFSECKY